MEFILVLSFEGIFKYLVLFDVYNDGLSLFGVNLKILIVSGYLKLDIVKVMYVFIIMNVICFIRILRFCFRKLVKVFSIF